MLRNVEQLVLIGCGGIGTWVLPPLLRFLHAERFDGAIRLWDGDRYGARNTSRQEFDPEALGDNKAAAQAREFLDRYPALRLDACPEYVTAANAGAAVPERAVVLVAVDNHPARALVARAAEQRREVCVLTAGNERHDGNVHVLLRRAGRPATTPLLERHPEIAAARRGDRAMLGCEALVERGETQLLVTNFLAAASLLAAFHLLWTQGERPGRRPRVGLPQEVYFDAGTCAMTLVPAAQG